MNCLCSLAMRKTVIGNRKEALAMGKLMIRVASIALLFTNYAFTAQLATSEVQAAKVVCMTVPKCGTHLLIKCISLLGVEGGLYAGGQERVNVPPPKGAWDMYDRLNKFDPPHHFKGPLHVPTVGPFPKILERSLRKNKKKRLFLSHWPYTPEAAELLQRSGTRNFFVIRDPRAMLVSMAFMLSKGWHGESADPHQLMLDLIDGRQQHFIRWGVTVQQAYPLVWENGVTAFYRLYTPWMKEPGMYTVHFERLVGDKGGGSQEAQLQEIEAIAKHIGLTVSREKIIEVRNNLFGGTTTFREGNIDGWKKHFSPEMKEAFKKMPGANELLIELGYEKDNNW